MFRSRIALPATLMALLPAACFPSGAGSRTPARAAGARFQVTQVEYRLLLSRTVLKAGRIDLAELDRGREQHDLRLRGGASGGEIRGKLLRPGARWEASVYLTPGTYRLWCSLPEHARYGMHAVLRVVR